MQNGTLTIQGTGSTITNGGQWFEPHIKNVADVIHKENDTHYETYVCLSGYTKKEVWINTIKEKEFLTLEIEFIGKFPTYPVVTKQVVKVIKNLNDIDQKKGIEVNMDNGLLMISIPKKYPIKRKELKF